MDKLDVENFGGFFKCETPLLGNFHSTCDNFTYSFSSGTYILSGEIDSGGWAFSASICSKKKKDNAILNLETKLYYNGNPSSLDEIRKHACDLGSKPINRAYQKSVKKSVEKGLKANHLSYTTEEIRQIFFIDEERFSRPLHCVGHEIFRCNAAIGLVNGKSIFCFPWFSQKMIPSFYEGIKRTCDTLTNLGCIVLLPISNQISSFNEYQIINLPCIQQKDGYS